MKGVRRSSFFGREVVSRPISRSIVRILTPQPVTTAHVRMMRCCLLFLVACVGLIDATIYFRDDFDSPKWAERWVQSEFSGKEFGKFDWTAGKFYGDDIKDKGIKTSQDARFYAISSKFEENKFSNEGKDLVIQYTGRFE